MNMRIALTLLPALALSACVSAPVRQGTVQPPRPPVAPPAGIQIPPTVNLPPPVAGFRMPEVMRERGLEGVIREDSASLQRRFGRPRLETREGDMRKLQFSSEACVLDLYLYPLAPGGEPVATWVEARRSSDGAEVDRAACVAALRAR